MAKRFIGALRGLALWRFTQWMARAWVDALNRHAREEAERERDERKEQKDE